MADEKKLKSEELTDEQANKAAGGFAIRTDFKCDGCGKDYSNTFCNPLYGKRYCTSCYTKIRSESFSIGPLRP